MKDILYKLRFEEPYIYDCLNKDINHFLSNFEGKGFIYSRLNLCKSDILLLKKCIKENIEIKDYEIIKKVLFYIDKIKYKIVLEKNYNSIDDLLESASTKNRLKSVGIFTVGDLIEFNDEELFSITGIGNVGFRTMINALDKKNIILLENPILVSERLKCENCGIVPYTMCESELEKIKLQLEKLYEARSKLLKQLNAKEEKIKKLEKKLGGMNEN